MYHNECYQPTPYFIRTDDLCSRNSSYNLAGSSSMSRFNTYGAARSAVYQPFATRMTPTSYMPEAYNQSRYDSYRSPAYSRSTAHKPHTVGQYNTTSTRSYGTTRSSSVDRFGRSPLDAIYKTGSTYVTTNHNNVVYPDFDDGYASGSTTAQWGTYRRRPSQDSSSTSSSTFTRYQNGLDQHNFVSDAASKVNKTFTLPHPAPGRVVKSFTSSVSSPEIEKANDVKLNDSATSNGFERNQPSRASQGSAQSSSSSSGCLSASESIRSLKKNEASPSKDLLSNGFESISINSPSTSMGLRGFTNIGNTCFMNSILQCLGHTKLLRDYCLVNSNLCMLECEKSNSKMKGALMTAYCQLLSQQWKKCRDPLTPSNFKSQVQKFAPRFSGYSQQDAQEFLRYLLQGLHEDVNRVTSKPKAISPIDDELSDEKKAIECWKQYLKIDNSAILDIFVGQLKSELTCTSCGNISTTFDPFWDLSLPIPSNKWTQVNIEDCFESLTGEEVLDGEEKPTCDKCRTKRRSRKRFYIHKFPKVLVLHLKRFSGEKYRSRLSTLVNFPINGLDLTKYASKGAHAIFDLFAVVNHTGTPLMGHYTAFVRHAITDSWLHYDDSRVTPTRESNLVKSDAYVLFYELHENQQSRL